MIQKIQMVDLKGQYEKIKLEVDTAIKNVIEETSFINGKIVYEFAENFASYNKVNHVITCGNGTDAIQIALMTLGLKEGDEVILPVHTYVATAEVIALLNLIPVFVDVDPYTYNIDIEKIESSITSKTKAIVPVHLYGQCANMEPILRIAKKYNIYVVEDAAQAVGAEYTFSDGSTAKAGTMGDLGCTSFFPSKNLGCFGDGGAILTNNDSYANTAKMIANHGQSKKYYHDIIGCNSRLDSMQAAILNVKLKYLDEYNATRLDVAERYSEALKNVPKIVLPEIIASSTHVFHQYTLQIKSGDRDLLKDRLAAVGIPTMIYYPVPLHLQKAYLKYGYTSSSFPIAKNLSKTVLSLPIHTEMNNSIQNYIIDNFIKALNE